MRLVVDTGPLIALSKTGHLDLLPQLFDDILIPAAVLGEVAKPGEMRPGSEIQNRSWIATLGVSIAERVALQKSGDIAAGEAEAILIAAEAPNSTVLLTDERRARRLAIERGLSYVTNGSPAGRCRSARPVATRRGPTGAAHSSARAIPGFSGGRGHPRPLGQSMRSTMLFTLQVTRFEDYLVALRQFSCRALSSDGSRAV